MEMKGQITEDEFYSLIEWGNCGTHCKGGQHVSMNCSYIIGEIKDLNLLVKFDGYRSTVKNRQVVLKTLWDLYVEMEK